MLQPTSLAYINGPNPVEPNATDHSASVARARQPDNLLDDDFLQSMLNPRGRFSFQSNDLSSWPYSANASLTALGWPSNAHVLSLNGGVDLLNPIDAFGNHDLISRDYTREADQAHLLLPPLPSQAGSQRQRPLVPPVLQGLHHPPRNAGFLPSINTENPQPSASLNDLSFLESNTSDGPSILPLNAVGPPNPPPRLSETINELSQAPDIPKLPRSSPKPVKASPAPRRNRWADEETHDLIKGVRRFGFGNWKTIHCCTDYTFDRRTPTDLKDRFRVLAINPIFTKRFQITDLIVTSKLPPSQTSVARSKSSCEAATPPLRITRRHRNPWTAAEDSCLERGLNTHGSSWHVIQASDPRLANRRPTDIRDRVRIRFPEWYKKAGLVPKPRSKKDEVRSAAVPSSSSVPALPAAPDPPPSQPLSPSQPAIASARPAAPDPPLALSHILNFSSHPDPTSAQRDKAPSRRARRGVAAQEHDASLARILNGFEADGGGGRRGRGRERDGDHEHDASAALAKILNGI